MITAVPPLNRSATSRASLKRFGSDLWIAEGADTGRGAAIVRTTPSASADWSATGWGRMRRTLRRLRLGHLVDEVFVFLDEPQVVQGLLPHAGHPRFLSLTIRPRTSPDPANHGVRAPNNAVPIRTIVAPSSTATW